MFDHTVPLTPTTQFGPTAAFSDFDAMPAVPDPSNDSVYSTLSSSLLSDLKRFGDDADAIELLPAIAASVRHGRPLALFVHGDHGLLRISVFPRAQLFHCAVDLCALPVDELSRLRLARVEPETALSPVRSAGTATGPLQFAALGPLLWVLAEYGSRGELLPEIAGSVRYRLAPGFSTRDLPVEQSAMPLLQRLRTATSSLHDLSEWTVRGPERVSRLLNALYLQAGLMVLRVSPVVRR